MRLPVNRFARCASIAFVLTLGSCGLGGGGERPAPADAGVSDAVGAVKSIGPEGDYPVVLGEPYMIDGREYVPSDIWNYDEVGYVTLDNAAGVTAAHKTLPLPSYVEMTSLESGQTVLVRVERRGPMDTAHIVSLSPAASEQLGLGEGGSVRVRRVNPPEVERALLRAGQSAPERLSTPASLLTVLKKKLPAAGSASLARKDGKPPQAAEPATKSGGDKADVQIAVNLPADTDIPQATVESIPPAAKPPKPRPAETPAQHAIAPKSRLVVQAAAFSSESNAKRAAKALGGYIVPKGKFFRVQTGPYANRGQANAALAKVKAAGYSDARVTNAG